MYPVYKYVNDRSKKLEVHREYRRRRKKQKNLDRQEELGGKRCPVSRVARDFSFDVGASRRCLRSTFISLPQITIVQTRSSTVTCGTRRRSRFVKANIDAKYRTRKTNASEKQTTNEGVTSSSSLASTEQYANE